MKGILIGADPEVFAMKDGKYVSAFGMIPGDKENPHPVENGAVQIDGMALEFNIDPVDTKEMFCHNINHVLTQLKGMVPDYEVVSDPVAYFTEDYIKEQPYKATELGCDPDFNAWEDGHINPRPDAKLPIRTGAGHVHFGFTEGVKPSDPIHGGFCRKLVRQLDFYLGLPSLLFDPDNTRRQLYGKAGAYRPKHYGVEYRVLSNKWLSDDRLIEWVYDNSVSAIEALRNGADLSKQFGDIQEIINTSDTEKAMGIINKAGIEVPHAI